MEAGTRLSDNGILFITTLFWERFRRFTLVDTAALALPDGFNSAQPIDPAVDHAQIIHDSERQHWVLSARVNGIVYVLETLWGPDRVRCPLSVEAQLKRLYGCSQYIVTPCVQQDDAIVCGYLDLAMLYHLNTGCHPEVVGRMKFDASILNDWLLVCVGNLDAAATIFVERGLCNRKVPDFPCKSPDDTTAMCS